LATAIFPGIAAGVPLYGVGPGAGGGGADFATIVLSFITWPGALDRYVDGLRTIWSTCTPSSRVCTRIVWLPLVGNLIVVACVNHQALSCQPHPAVPHPLQFSRFTINAPVDPIR
jgi:hypothetical protein